MKPAEFWIEMLAMQQHPEGGWFAEVYRSEGVIPQQVLPPQFTGDRNFSTSIYFLLKGDEHSAFHRIGSDEIWHFYEGCAIDIYRLTPDRKLRIDVLGRDIEHGEKLQAVVPAGDWFAAKPRQENSYSLVGCTVAPGFDFDDFELAKKSQLLRDFPKHVKIIERFCIND